MEGLGFLIWKIKTILPIENVIQQWKNIGIRWVSIKLNDGIYPYNRIDATGNYTRDDTYVKSLIERIKASGIEVGTWHFIYTKDTKAQAQIISNTIRTFGLSHLLIDAEEVGSVGAWWKTLPTNVTTGLALEYMGNLSTPVNFPVALCSYRYPSLHRSFPFAAFVNHPKSKHISAQVYWVGSSNSAYQLERCIKEYNAFRWLPHIPIGAAYREFGWEPTPAQIASFIATAKKFSCPGWGFWSWDSAKARLDWLEAMRDTVPVPPPPPPPPPEEGDDMAKLTVIKGPLNVRSAIKPSVKYGAVPGVIYPSSIIYFSIPEGTVVDVIEEIQDGQNTWVRSGIKQYVAKVYDDIVYLQ